MKSSNRNGDDDINDLVVVLVLTLLMKAVTAIGRYWCVETDDIAILLLMMMVLWNIYNGNDDIDIDLLFIVFIVIVS